jgi:small subunit ribosomal protein S13
MIFLFNSELIDHKIVSFSLTSVYGIGKVNSILITKYLGFSHNLRIKDLSEIQLDGLEKAMGVFNFKFGTELKKTNQLLLNKLIDIRSYKGLRRYKGLPIRGQRTHTNSKTAKKRRR